MDIKQFQVSELQLKGSQKKLSSANPNTGKKILDPGKKFPDQVTSKIPVQKSDNQAQGNEKRDYVGEFLARPEPTGGALSTVVNFLKTKSTNPKSTTAKIQKPVPAEPNRKLTRSDLIKELNKHAFKPEEKKIIIEAAEKRGLGNYGMNKQQTKAALYELQRKKKALGLSDPLKWGRVKKVLGN
ncbi:MAG TPA: hypothetical protein P5267_01625 [Patescibacteria group bacterium]|nr:hypothetical protein [Patescibacteria group bacterium]